MHPSGQLSQTQFQLNILLVEDDDGDAKAVQRAFQKSQIGARIVRAVDGIEALDVLKGANGKTKPASPNILLVDLNMPRMNGIQLVKALRADEELRRTIVFILSTSKRDDDKLAAYDLNVAGYITKARAAAECVNLVNLLKLYADVVELP
jgi:CheY-like chemotaxis protein